MLTKEYRICMPMTVEDYRIAQLYMIQKKSREESTGSESGVEIMTNEPYEDGPGGKGQYTFKIFHVGSHLPAWFRNILPRSALRVEEEAWNAYPYTKTRYRVPFVEKFTLEVETKYIDDNGEQDDVFEMSSSERQNRIVDFLDMVKDPIPPGDYKTEEDPRLYVSDKTGRGPLSEIWRDEYMIAQAEGKQYPPYQVPGEDKVLKLPKRIMCAYKLCKVEFKYWGMQNKIERFIHDVALRKTMLRAHRQAWCWQDEWYGLTIEDIRALEAETARALAEKMALARGELAGGAEGEEGGELAISGDKSSKSPKTEDKKSNRKTWEANGKEAAGSTPPVWTPRSLLNLEADSDNDEFYDAPDDIDAETASFMTCKSNTTMGTFGTCNEYSSREEYGQEPGTPTNKSQKAILFLVVHGGSLLDTNHEYHNKNVDISTLRKTIQSVITAHYPSLQNRVAVRLVACPPVVTDTLHTIASMSPYAFDMQGHLENVLAHDFVPLGTIPLFFTSSSKYEGLLETVASRLNTRYSEFLRSEEGSGFSGPVCIVGDSTGSILTHDLLCMGSPRPAHNHDPGSRSSLQEEESDSDTADDPVAQLKPSNNLPDSGGPGHSMSNADGDQITSSKPRTSSAKTSNSSSFSSFNLDFEVHDFFMLGSPIALVLAFRQAKEPDVSISSTKKAKSLAKVPRCRQVYNLFHLTDPCSFRVEPLLDPRFRHIAPVRVSRYARYPLGDGQPLTLVECLVQQAALFSAPSTDVVPGVVTPTLQLDTTSTSSDCADIALAHLPALRRKWWGHRRVDLALHSPDALQTFPIKALPHLLHASYWESTDVASFIMRQLTINSLGDAPVFDSVNPDQFSDLSVSPQRPKCKNRGNSIKLKSASPNHRANDVIVLDDQPRILSARFMYGPLDVLSLTGEMVDVHVMVQPPNGHWEFMGTEVTDSGGRVHFKLPESKHLSAGMYPVKMVVRADLSSVTFTLAVLPSNTEAVVFSVDGSFAASVSIMGKDPKVRAGGVDVVRHWQDLGYLLIYITARPDMQQRRVVNWLAHHNFPHGMVFFADGISSEPLRQKSNILQRLVNDTQIKFHCAYGSAKDISIYKSLGMQPNQIFAVGKASKKHTQQATLLTEGYAAHLNDLITRSPLSRPAHGAASLMLRKTCFELPYKPLSRKRSSSRRGGSISSVAGGGNSPGPGIMSSSSAFEATTGEHGAMGGSLHGGSLNVGVGIEGNTIVDGGSTGAYQKARGLSPRVPR